MSKRAKIILVVAIIAVVVAGVYLYRKNKAKKDATKQTGTTDPNAAIKTMPSATGTGTRSVGAAV